MEIHLKISGIIMLLLGILHIPFPKYFDWKKDLHNLTLINRQMMYVHTFFIGITVTLMGALCLFCSHDVVTTPLGKKICAGLGVFWVLRWFCQFFVYSPQLWKRKTFETATHIAFSFIWTYFIIVFITAALRN